MATTPGEIPEVGLFSDEQQFINFMANIFGRDTDSSSSTEVGGQGMDAWNMFLSRMLPDLDSDQYSPAAAERDAKGVVDQIFQAYREGNLPEIYQQQNASGGYNSTTAQLLANDAFSRATAAGAAAVTKTKESYANIRARNMQMFMQAVNTMMNLSRRTTAQQTSGQLSDSAKKAALAAQAAKALANKSGKKTPKQNKSKPSRPLEVGASDGVPRDFETGEPLDAWKDWDPDMGDLQQMLDAGTQSIIGQEVDFDMQHLAESTMPDLSGLDFGGFDDPIDFGGFLDEIPDPEFGEFGDFSDTFWDGDFDLGEPLENIPEPEMEDFVDYDFDFGEEDFYIDDEGLG